MRVDVGQLEKAAKAAQRAQGLVQSIVLMSDGRIEDMAREADDSVTTVLRSLRDMGASALQPTMGGGAEIPFHLLSLPDLEELEGLLLRARVLADAIDKRRGFADPVTGEGFVWGERVRELEARAGLELRGVDSVRE